MLELGEFLQRYRELYVSINLSAPDLTSRRFLERLTSALAAGNIAPQQIRIEATERCFLDADAAKEVIQAFRDAGHPGVYRRLRDGLFEPFAPAEFPGGRA